MPPLILLAIVGAGCFAGYKLFSKLIEQAKTPSAEELERNRRQARAATSQSGPKNLGELEWDDEAGVYKPNPDVKS